MSDPSRLLEATADLEAPFAFVDMDAFWGNAADMERRAAGKPIRLASKSVRCRSLQARVLDRAGFSGTLAFTLPEAIWLTAQGFDDILVAYPTADRRVLGHLVDLMETHPETRLVVMVDSVAHLELIEEVVGDRSATIQVCIDIDAGLSIANGRIVFGAKRSPIRDAGSAVALARDIERRPGVELVGVMAYEAQVAGVGDDPPSDPVRRAAVRIIRKRSLADLTERRAEIVAELRRVAPLRFVNGGGTGSIEDTVEEDAITEIGAGSGLFAPHLFDNYRSFTPRPAAMFALPVVRRPSAGVVTVLGGGYLASGPADRQRLPKPYHPRGLKLDGQEGAGEVQTPVRGPAADALQVGDVVLFRHAKAGELCERFASLYLIEEGRVVDEVSTYRGEGQTFL